MHFLILANKKCHNNFNIKCVNIYITLAVIVDLLYSFLSQYSQHMLRVLSDLVYNKHFKQGSRQRVRESVLIILYL